MLLSLPCTGSLLILPSSETGWAVHCALRLCGSSAGEYPVYLHTQPWSYAAILLYTELGFRLQKTDTFAGYENQYEQGMQVLRTLLTPQQYDRLAACAE